MVKKERKLFGKWGSAFRARMEERKRQRKESQEEREQKQKGRETERTTRREERQERHEKTGSRRREGFKRFGDRLLNPETGVFKRVGSFYQSTLGKILQYPKDMLEASPIGQIGKLGQGKQTLIYIVGGIAAIMLLVVVMKTLTKTSPVGLLTGK